MFPARVLRVVRYGCHCKAADRFPVRFLTGNELVTVQNTLSDFRLYRALGFPDNLDCIRHLAGEAD